jgi:hypothetical protein
VSDGNGARRTQHFVCHDFNGIGLRAATT